MSEGEPKPVATRRLIITIEGALASPAALMRIAASVLATFLATITSPTAQVRGAGQHRHAFGNDAVKLSWTTETTVPDEKDEAA